MFASPTSASTTCATRASPYSPSAASPSAISRPSPDTPPPLPRCRGTSTTTAHAVLHRALKQAVRWGLLRNVTEGVDIPKLVRDEIAALSLQETRAFLTAARGDGLEALYAAAVHCGLRCGELLRLKWSDIDLDARTLSVNRQVQRMRDGSGLAFSTPQNSKFRRTIRLTNATAEALSGHRKWQTEEKLRHASASSPRPALYAVDFACGLREGELLSLMRKDVDLNTLLDIKLPVRVG